MNKRIPRSDGWMTRAGLAAPPSSRRVGWLRHRIAFGAVCILLAILAAAMPARGQCSPVEQAKLTASDAAANDFLGYSIAISGDTAVVGAYNDTHAGGSTAGSAYIFIRAGGVWTEQAKLTASDAADGDWFGYSVALSGDTAVIGAPYDDYDGWTDTGSAYVFTRSAGVWTQQAKLTASDAAASDNFGVSVAISGDTAVVGAWHDANASGIDAGSAYVFDLGCDSDGDGVLNVNDVCPNNALGLPVDCTGQPLRDANDDCLVNTDDVPLIVDELLSVAVPPTGCNGRPLRDTNGDSAVDGADIQLIVNEMLDQ